MENTYILFYVMKNNNINLLNYLSLNTLIGELFNADIITTFTLNILIIYSFPRQSITLGKCDKGC